MDKINLSGWTDAQLWDMWKSMVADNDIQDAMVLAVFIQQRPQPDAFNFYPTDDIHF